MLIQCGLFVGIPLLTLLIGIWLITFRFPKLIGQRLAVATLWGIVAFEAAMIGMLIDPRSDSHSLAWILEIAIIIGITNFLFVIVTSPIYTWISKNLFSRNSE